MLRNNRGFTLIELLVGLAVSSLAMGAIYNVYLTQQRSYTVQQDIAMMQQNLRAAMFLMTNELRMAGYDPSGNASAGISSIAETSVRFTKDEDKDGTIETGPGIGEDVTYDIDTDAGTGVKSLYRNDQDTDAPIATNIDAIHLFYLDEDSAIVSAGNEDDIRSIQITLVAKTSKYNSLYKDSFTYSDLQGGSHVLAVGGDGYRRAALSTQVQCRNMGL